MKTIAKLTTALLTTLVALLPITLPTTKILLKLIAGLGLSAAIALLFILPAQATELDPDRHNLAMPQPPATSTDLSASCEGGVGDINDLITAIEEANDDLAADVITPG